MVIYYCKKCKYKIQKQELPTSCNYCGAQGSMASEDSAEQILDLD